MDAITPDEQIAIIDQLILSVLPPTQRRQMMLLRSVVESYLAQKSMSWREIYAIVFDHISPPNTPVPIAANDEPHNLFVSLVRKLGDPPTAEAVLAPFEFYMHAAAFLEENRQTACLPNEGRGAQLISLDDRRKARLAMVQAFRDFDVPEAQAKLAVQELEKELLAQLSTSGVPTFVSR